VSTKCLLAVAFSVVAICALAVGESRANGTGPWRIVVNGANPATAVDRRFLADAFLKKVTRWSTGDTIKPVDQRVEAPVRQRFSEDVIGRSVAAVKSYWAQLVFSGRDVPPPELENDDEVVRYVLKNAGAVGYVSQSANVDRVKILSVR